MHLTTDTTYNVDKYMAMIAGHDHRNRIRRLLPFMTLKPTDRVLDVGCAAGIMLDVIQERIGFYQGVDICEEFIGICKSKFRRFRDVDFKTIDECDLSALQGKTYDVAFLTDVAEHVSDKDLLSTIESIYDLLKVGGALYIHTPNSTFFIEIMKDKGLWPQLPEHIAVRNAKQYLVMLTRAGYFPVRVHRLSHYLGALSWLHPLSRIPFIGKFFEARLFIEAIKGS